MSPRVRLALLALLAGSLFTAAVWISRSQTAQLRNEVDDLRAQVAALQDLVSPPSPPIVIYTEYGFGLPLPDGVPIVANGVGGGQASKEAGQVSVSAGGVSMLIFWSGLEKDAKVLVRNGFEAMKASQPAIVFFPNNQGDITVDGQKAAFGIFDMLNRDGVIVGYGLLGGWACGSTGYSLTLVGQDLDAVETSFTGLTEGFRCQA